MDPIKNKIYESYFTAKVNKDGKHINAEDLLIWSKNTYNRIKEYLPADLDSKILDLGTGTGNFLFLLNNYGYRNLTGVDISGEQIEIAKELVPNADLRIGDIIDFLNQKESQYNLISGFDIIEHFTRQEAYDLMLKVNKALKPNGRVILQTPNAYSPWSGAVCYGDLTHEWFYTPNSLDDLLIQCNFHKYQAKEIEPVALGVKGLIRLIVWKIVKQFYKVFNMAEIGSFGKDQIFSRVFIATAIKKD